MEYTIKQIFPETPNCRVVLSIELDYHGWCELEKSDVFHRLSEFVRNLQTQDNLEQHQEHLSL